MENLQKAFVTLGRFWPLRGGGLGESVKKRKICDENLFQIMLNEVLKSFKNSYLLYKTDAKQEIKELVAVSYKFPEKYLLKT